MSILAEPLRADGLAADSPARPPLAPATWRTNPAIRFVAFCGVGVILLLAMTIVPVLFPRAIQERYWPALQFLVTAVPALAAYLVVARVLERRRAPVELRLRGLAPRLGLGAVAGMVLVGLCFGLIVALGGYVVTGSRSASEIQWGFLIFISGLQAGVTEEILFRGVLQRLTEEGLGSWASLALWSAVFGLAHLGNPNATVVGTIIVALIGVTQGALYLLTRSLWVCIGMHLAWNLTQGLLFGTPVSGTSARGWLVGHPTGDPLLSGGAFGVEASVVTAVIMTLVAAGLVAWIARRGLAVAPYWVRRRRAGVASTTAS